MSGTKGVPAIPLAKSSIGRALPFICGGQSDDPRLFAATEALLQCMDDPLDAFAEEDAIYDLVQVMAGVAGQRRRARQLAGAWSCG